jgi:D-glycero-D-manno-heptose 1,7-bisphosphate phosphatase
MIPAGFSAPDTGYPIDSDCIWCEVRRHARRGGAALFLDRDGVVVKEIDHLCRVEDVAVLPRAAAVIGVANRQGIPVVLVTNQAGIGRGLYGWAEFLAVQNAVIAVLEPEGARFDAVYACPHHAHGKGNFWYPDHPARKPNPGMILRAAADLDLDLKRSWLVGDKTIDVEAAKRAGLAGAMQVMTGYGAAEWPSSVALATAIFEVRQGRSIADAATLPIFGGLGL